MTVSSQHAGWNPEEFRDRAVALARGEVEPVAARDAATVVLLRDAEPTGVEVFMLRRRSGMTFAGGFWVFPGGAVDARDQDWGIDWIGPEPGGWADVLGADEPLCRALVCAAVRETFEEAGVLLAGSAESIVPVDSHAEHWRAEQAMLHEGAVSMRDVLVRNNLALRADLLHPWAHWTTPEVEPKRFDTRFFLAALPSGQTPEHFVGEASDGGWHRPGDFLLQHAAGEILMLPPTVVTLSELSEFGSVADVLVAAAEREVRHVLPKVLVTPDQVRFVLPGDDDYPTDARD